MGEALPPCQAPQEHDQDCSSCVWRLQGYCAREEKTHLRVTRRYRSEKAVVMVEKRRKKSLILGGWISQNLFIKHPEILSKTGDVSRYG